MYKFNHLDIKGSHKAPKQKQCVNKFPQNHGDLLTWC